MQKNVGKPTKAAVNVPAKNLFSLKVKPKLPNSKWAQQFAVSNGTKCGATTVVRFLEKSIREASGNSEFL